MLECFEKESNIAKYEDFCCWKNEAVGKTQNDQFTLKLVMHWTEFSDWLFTLCCLTIGFKLTLSLKTYLSGCRFSTL